MAQATPRLTRRTVVLAKIQSGHGVDASPTAASDALLVMEPDFSADPQMLERSYVRDDLSPIGTRTGRTLATMKLSVEARGNGRENSGSIGDAPLIGRLFRACGMSETAISGAGTVGAVRDVQGDAVGPVVSWVAANNNGSGEFREYLLTCVLGGASATAKIRVDELNGYESGNLKNENVTCTAASVAGTVAVDLTDPLAPTITVGGTWATGEKVNFNVNGFEGSYTTTSSHSTTNVADGLAAAIAAMHADLAGTDNSSAVVTIDYANDLTGVTVTSGTTALDLGSSGVTMTPTWTGDLVLGQQWRVCLWPAGIQYQPVSDNQEEITLYMYLDGYLHKMVDAQGTWQFDAKAGEFGKFSFDFTGQYEAPVDALFPSGAVYEINPEPPIFQLAKLRLDSEDITIQSLTLNLMNTVTPREDANASDGYNGVRITARKPEGGVDPEATLVGQFDFWARLKNSNYMPFSVRVGNTAGNTVWVNAPAAQYTKTTYKDRNGIRTYDAGLGFAREQGNDEIRVTFA